MDALKKADGSESLCRHKLIYNAGGTGRTKCIRNKPKDERSADNEAVAFCRAGHTSVFLKNIRPAKDTINLLAPTSVGCIRQLKAAYR